MAAEADAPKPPMRRDIARQPEILRALAARGAAFAACGAQHLRPGVGGRVFITGCGDGIFAAQAASAVARRCGLDWRPIGALDLVLDVAQLRATDRVLAISMSGNVDRTVEAAQATAAAGVPLLALVNGAGGRLGAIAGARISLDLPELAPFLCGTASYTATLAALMLLAAGAGDGGGVATSVAAAAGVQRAALAAAEAALGMFSTLAPSGVRLLSAGAESGTAQYGAAKFVELTRIPVWHGELEEFAHSQFWAMPATDLVVIIAAGPVLARYADEACAALAGLEVRSLAIDTTAAPIPRATHRVTLPEIDAAFAPLATAIPLQLLAYALAQQSGLDPNTRLHLKNDTRRFTASRQLTRRTLIGTGA